MTTSILLVDDNPGLIQAMGRILTGLGEIRIATTGETALTRMRESVPDLVLLDAEMPGISGFDVCRTMQDDPSLRDIPVIFVTGHSAPAFELEGLQLGAVDFIAKPVSAPLLVARVKTQLRVKRLTDELRALVGIDAMTNLPNRRTFDEALDREWRCSLRAGEPISVLMIDVDHFKLYNDRYGHPAGDGCLRAVADALRAVTQRPGDLVARYGGEEFVLLLPKTPREGARNVARRVLDAISRLALPHDASPTSRYLSVSVGAGCHNGESASWTGHTTGPVPRHGSGSLLCSADRALYAAKAQGRARAFWVDVDDIGTPTRAREALPVSGSPLLTV